MLRVEYCEEQWESEFWTGLMLIKADSIEHANTLINEHECGVVKVFGYPNVE